MLLSYYIIFSKISVELKICINEKFYKTEFLLHSGSDTPLILIAVFSSLGGLLLILCIVILVIKRRRRRVRQDNSGDNHHHSQSPLPRAQVFSGDNVGHEEDDWSSVDLNSPGHSNSSFFNGGFSVRTTQ